MARRINQSKINDPRFRKKWEYSGAMGTMEDAIRRLEGETIQPPTFPNYSVDRGTFTFTGPMQSRFFIKESQARAYFSRDINNLGPHVQLVRWDDKTSGKILADRYQSKSALIIY